MHAGARGGQKRAAVPWKMDFRGVVSSSKECWNLNRDLFKSTRALITWASLQPLMAMH